VSRPQLHITIRFAPDEPVPTGEQIHRAHAGLVEVARAFDLGDVMVNAGKDAASGEYVLTYTSFR
jgi:hypothetical protein